MGIPRWATRLFPHIRLTDGQLERLESIRLDAGASEESMELHIQTHPECTKMLQRTLFSEMKSSDPTASDEMILMHLLYSRLLTARLQGVGLLGVNVRTLQNEANPPRDLLDAIHSAMTRRGIRTVDELADAIAADEASLPSVVPTSPRLEGAASRITDVLREQKTGSAFSPRASKDELGVVVEAVAALEHLAGRGAIRLNEEDKRLLARPCQSGGVSWLGGIRENSLGQLEFIDAIACNELPPNDVKRIGQIVAAAYLGFYDAAADGVALVAAGLVKERYGKSVRENYPEAGEAFVRFATTYWTLRTLIDRLAHSNAQCLALSLLVRIDDLLGELFFPHEGPFKVDSDRRAIDQRRFLRTFGPRVEVDDFLSGNPILGRDRRHP